MEKRVFGCGCAVPQESKDERNKELRQDAARIVAGVENYSGADRTRRGADIKAAWPPVGKPAAKTATKPAAAKPMAKAATKPATAKKAGTMSAKYASKPASKTISKGPTPAGMSVGRHDGDLC